MPPRSKPPIRTTMQNCLKVELNIKQHDHLTLIIRQTVDLPSLKSKASDCCESPVARWCRVTASFSLVEIGLRPHKRLCCDISRGSTNECKCSNLSGDMRINLQNTSMVIFHGNLRRKLLYRKLQVTWKAVFKCHPIFNTYKPEI